MAKSFNDKPAQKICQLQNWSYFYIFIFYFFPCFRVFPDFSKFQTLLLIWNSLYSPWTSSLPSFFYPSNCHLWPSPPLTPLSLPSSLSPAPSTSPTSCQDSLPPNVIYSFSFWGLGVLEKGLEYLGFSASFWLRNLSLLFPTSSILLCPPELFIFPDVPIRMNDVTTSSVFLDSLFIDDSLITCEVCFEAFNHQTRPPKLLPCGHNFCESCIFSLCLHQEVSVEISRSNLIWIWSFGISVLKRKIHRFLSLMRNRKILEYRKTCNRGGPSGACSQRCISFPKGNVKKLLTDKI